MKKLSKKTIIICVSLVVVVMAVIIGLVINKDNNTKVSSNDTDIKSILNSATKLDVNINSAKRVELTNIDLKDNYEDCGCLLYDLKKQDVKAGASGPTSSALVTFSYIIDEMKKGNIKRVLLVATGALMSPTMMNQKLTIPSISHAVSLEAI